MIHTLKSIGAIVAGFLTVVMLSIVTDMIVEGIGFFPGVAHPELYTWWMLLIALAYRTVFTVLGGYVTALLAPGNKMKHVTVLAILGTIGGAIGVMAGWKYGNNWYPIALALLAYPSVWYGGMWRMKRMKTS